MSSSNENDAVNNSFRTFYEENSGPIYPPLSIAMMDLVITPTGFPDKVSRDEYCDKVREMGGEVRYPFNDRTTHLLAFHTNTNKVLLARKKNVPVVTREWIEKIWKYCHTPYNPRIPFPDHNKFPNVCPIFHNLWFYISKSYDEEARAYLERELMLRGGIISPFLKTIPAMYFYICPRPENNTVRLYRLSIQEGLHCITEAWVIDSINMGTLANPFEYDVRNHDDFVKKIKLD